MRVFRSENICEVPGRQEEDMVDIREYQAEDIECLHSVWNESLVYDRINLAGFYRKVIFDVNFDPGKLLVAVDRDEFLGFIYAVKRRTPDGLYGMEPEQGWIVAMGVKPSRCGQGIGRALLAEAEKRLIGEGAKRIDVGPYTTNYICPGVDNEHYAPGLHFFTKNGYVEDGSACSMHMNLRSFIIPDRYIKKKKALMAMGYSFTAFKAVDALDLFAFLRENFAQWLPDVRNAILAGRAEETLILAHDKDRRTAGFVLRAMDGTPERFGPFGVSPALQGMGLGAVLFHEMMENMVTSRIFYTYFLWGDGRNPEIYGSWGMKIYRSYAMLHKDITEQP
jgi:GNAT superfamily N-acetyltransferase